jgi:glucosylglycerate synthase
VDIESIPRAARERIDRIASADLMVGVLSDRAGDASVLVRQALEKLPQVRRTVIFQSNGAGGVEDTSKANSTEHGNGVDEAGPPSDQTVFVVPVTLMSHDTSIGPVENIANAYKSVLAAGEKLGARAVCVLASDLQSVASQWIWQLVHPVLQLGFDLVTPCYAHGKFEGLLNNCLISPLTRALYGSRIQNPMGPDVGISRRLFQRLIGSEHGAKLPPDRTLTLASIAPTAICGGSKICQAHVGARIYPPVDWTNLSSLLVQVLGPVFLDVERNAACWQRPRDSVSTPSFGERLAALEERGAVDVGRMRELFRLGVRDLLEVWSLLLPPAILFELKKISGLPPEKFRVPDELWARIVYDFALGHRLRTISRDHLLRAMTPLYLGWVASYALEMQDATLRAAEQRFERLGQAFETAKPYLVSRWRWPDRFNP